MFIIAGHACDAVEPAHLLPMIEFVWSGLWVKRAVSVGVFSEPGCQGEPVTVIPGPVTPEQFSN